MACNVLTDFDQKHISAIKSDQEANPSQPLSEKFTKPLTAASSQSKCSGGHTVLHHLHLHLFLLVIGHRVLNVPDHLHLINFDDKFNHRRVDDSQRQPALDLAKREMLSVQSLISRIQQRFDLDQESVSQKLSHLPYIGSLVALV